jgi:hypothetical protein
MSKARLQVPDSILAELRRICLALPDAYEEAAWVGTRWRIRKQTFAHVLMISDGWPPAYARAAGQAGPVCVLTFRSWDREFDPPEFSAAPYFRPVWFRNILGVVLDEHSDWAALTEHLTASYRVMAPKVLGERLTVRTDPP